MEVVTNDLISRNALLKDVGQICDRECIDSSGIRCRGCNVDYVFDMIESAPAVDTASGRWLEVKGSIQCSECMNSPLYDYHGRPKLSEVCPTCGIKMQKGKQDDKSD